MRPLAPLPSDRPAVDEAARLPRGFRALATSAGIKDPAALDLAVVIVEEDPAAVAATFTTNRLPAAAVRMDREHLAATAPQGGCRYGWVAAMMSTSGCANAATGEEGLADQRRLAGTLAAIAGTQPDRVLAMSTGLIGTRLPIQRVADALTAISGSFRRDDQAFADVAEAMRTTDSRAKAAAVRLELPGPDGAPVAVTVGGVAKGVGMIHPHMATMLSFVLTDAEAHPETLQYLLRPIVARTWNQTSVDGDQSTNDTVLLVASGAAGAAPVAALAQPDVHIMASTQPSRPSPSGAVAARWALFICTAAAGRRLVVKVAAMAAGPSCTSTSARSGAPESLMPAVVPRAS